MGYMYMLQFYYRRASKKHVINCRVETWTNDT